MQRYSNHYGISVKSYFTNYSNKNLVVKYRSGLIAMVPRGECPTLCSEGRLEIEIDFFTPNLLKFDATGVTKPLDKEIFRQIEAKIKNIEAGYLPGLNLTSHSLTVDIELNEKYATQGNNAIESDFLAADIFVNPTDTLMNDYGPKAAQNSQRVRLNQERHELGSLAVEIMFKDDQGLAGTLWTQLFGDSVQIPTKTGGKEPDGIYITRLGTSSVEPKVTFIPLKTVINDPATLVKHGLYLTKKEADEGGHSKLVQELQSRVAALQRDAAKERERLKEIQDTLIAKVNQLQEDLREQRQVSALLKHQQKIVEERNKSTMEAMKNKQSSTNGTDFIKNMIGIAGLFFSGIKIFGLK